MCLQRNRGIDLLVSSWMEVQLKTLRANILGQLELRICKTGHTSLILLCFRLGLTVSLHAGPPSDEIPGLEVIPSVDNK